MEILAVWKEPPSLFSNGLMQWVAEVRRPDGLHRMRESPPFPIEGDYVTEDKQEQGESFICIVREKMDPERRKIVETMHEEFVASLERDGWAPTGPGRDWYNLHFERTVRL
jgi:hypothetical protein